MLRLFGYNPPLKNLRQTNKGVFYMTAKELNKAIETFFASQKPKECSTYESLIELFDKQPTLAQAANIHKLIQKHKACIYTSSEHAKLLNDKEAEARKSAQRKMIENNETDSFDILKEHELLEWSRSDSLLFVCIFVKWDRFRF